MIERVLDLTELKSKEFVLSEGYKEVLRHDDKYNFALEKRVL